MHKLGGRRIPIKVDLFAAIRSAQFTHTREACEAASTVGRPLQVTWTSSSRRRTATFITLNRAVSGVTVINSFIFIHRGRRATQSVVFCVRRYACINPFMSAATLQQGSFIFLRCTCSKRRLLVRWMCRRELFQPLVIYAFQFCVRVRCSRITPILCLGAFANTLRLMESKQRATGKINSAVLLW